MLGIPLRLRLTKDIDLFAFWNVRESPRPRGFSLRIGSSFFTVSSQRGFILFAVLEAALPTREIDSGSK